MVLPHGQPFVFGQELVASPVADTQDNVADLSTPAPPGTVTPSPPHTVPNDPADALRVQPPTGRGGLPLQPIQGNQQDMLHDELAELMEEQLAWDDAIRAQMNSHLGGLPGQGGCGSEGLAHTAAPPGPSSDAITAEAVGVDNMDAHVHIVDTPVSGETNVPSHDDVCVTQSSHLLPGVAFPQPEVVSTNAHIRRPPPSLEAQPYPNGNHQTSPVMVGPAQITAEANHVELAMALRHAEHQQAAQVAAVNAAEARAIAFQHELAEARAHNDELTARVQTSSEEAVANMRRYAVNQMRTMLDRTRNEHLAQVQAWQQERSTMHNDIRELRAALEKLQLSSAAPPPQEVQNPVVTNAQNPPAVQGRSRNDTPDDRRGNSVYFDDEHPQRPRGRSRPPPVADHQAQEYRLDADAGVQTEEEPHADDGDQYDTTYWDDAQGCWAQVSAEDRPNPSNAAGTGLSSSSESGSDTDDEPDGRTHDIKQLQLQMREQRKLLRKVLEERSSAVNGGLAGSSNGPPRSSEGKAPTAASVRAPERGGTGASVGFARTDAPCENASSQPQKKNKKRRDDLASSESDQGGSDDDYTVSDADTPELPALSNTDSDKHLKRAMRNEMPEIRVPAFPTMTNLNAFKVSLVEAVVFASGRSDHARVARWIRRVEYPKIKVKQLADPGCHYESLDRKLAFALTNIASGEFGRHLDNVKRRMFKNMDGKNGRLISGRQILWIMYKHFRTNKDMGSIANIVDLTKVPWRGDNQIEKFRNDWENTVVNLHFGVSRRQMAVILLEQMSNSMVLKSRVDRYRRKYPDDKKSYSRLIGILDRHIQEQRQVANRKQLDNEQRRHLAAPVNTANCRNWLSGSCTRGKNCPYVHDRAIKGVAVPKAPPPTPRGPPPAAPVGGKSSSTKGKGKHTRSATPKAQPKARAKSKGKGKGSKPYLCLDFQTGSCRNPDCRYRHAKASTPDEHAQLARAHERRSNSPAAGRGVCHSWANTGSCRHGNACTFTHSQGAKGKGGKGGKGSGPRPRSNSRARSKPRPGQTKA